MAKSKFLLLAAGLVVSVFTLIVIFRATEKEIGQEEISRQEIIIREFREETAKEEKIEGEIAEEETAEEIKQPEVKIEEIKEIEETKDYQETNWQWLAKQKPIYQLAAAEINSILKELQRKFPGKEERLKALALWRLGTPYQLGPLGEEKGRDPDPIFRIDLADCTVFILTTAALLHSDNLEEARGSLSPQLISPLAYAREMMKFLNYRSEEITFESRLHFTIDRNEVSPYFRDITREVIQAEKIRQKEVILNKIKADGKRLIDIDWEKSIILNYIPHQHITPEFLQGLPPAIGIAFVRENDAAIGLDVAHEGFLFHGKTLIHASSVQKKVVEENFLDYYFINEKTPRFQGILLFELN